MEANRKTLSYDQMIAVCGLRKNMAVIVMDFKKNSVELGRRGKDGGLFKSSI